MSSVWRIPKKVRGRHLLRLIQSRAFRPKIFTGGRAVLKLNGVPVAYASGVSFSMDPPKPVHVLGCLDCDLSTGYVCGQCWASRRGEEY